MAEVSIDQSKLPGVKEVCRDFAVLEDHTLAHSLQEQEIEHHLASNVQRNRLVQHDLQVAKQLQEEDLKAQAQLQKRYKDLEQQDCEIAQEIQEKLAIEAERRRIQEKKDEDIARLLQEKELQEEKKRKKHFPESPGANAYGDNYYYEDGGMKPRVMKEAVSTPSRVTNRDQEWYDAEIARKLQEEEILATQVDIRAAQVAQDEEIARLLMAEEKKAYKKAREREKSSLDKRKHDPEWKPKTAKSAHSKSKESDEPHHSKSDRPARPLPATMTEAEDLDYTHFTNQHNSTRHFSKSESSHKAQVSAHDLIGESEKRGAGDVLVSWAAEVLTSFRLQCSSLPSVPVIHLHSFIYASLCFSGSFFTPCDPLDSFNIRFNIDIMNHF
ncbi:coiled-coil domain-containing protein 50 isoform X3 [Physeter macrocephalus]|uniref:Coiled-coil domain-containing protein 50 isoform X3 n=1 Tax=Physeter macrocephalus TaxID=9755 RepID=A0A455BJS3_PHYMC|nr:coiled-coil domain-containing protein 50 isoform X3 [Physeter catodon]|eukprot:XP_028348138.1 coiled-coil domain-containing protein 50 isoform X3 [Physeter catodon]